MKAEKGDVGGWRVARTKLGVIGWAASPSAPSSVPAPKIRKTRLTRCRSRYKVGLLSTRPTDWSGVSNVTLRHVRTVDEMVNLERVDLVYSLIVLQHNPPPVIRLIVRAFLKALNPGGVAYLQVPTYRVGYRSSPGEYLENEAKKHVMMEMHVLPQRVIFTAREESCELVEVLEDGSTGLRFGKVSKTFLIRKTA